MGFSGNSKRAVVAVCFMATGLPALAESQCTVFSNWIDQVETLQPDSDVRAPEALVTSVFSDPDCSQSLALSGQRSIHCAWAFSYRGADARAGFDAITEELAQCYSARLRLEKQNPVNHPDSYDLLEFRSTREQISVSLKDKGALQQTYIFLRAERQSD